MLSEHPGHEPLSLSLSKPKSMLQGITRSTGMSSQQAAKATESNVTLTHGK